MLISWRYKFVFVHIPKTGGTAFTAALAPFARLRDRFAYDIARKPIIRRAVTTALGPVYEQRITGIAPHSGVRVFERKFGASVLDDMTVLTIVRNPFTRFISYFRHINRIPNHKMREAVQGMTFQQALPVLLQRGANVQTRLLEGVDGATPKGVIVAHTERLSADIADWHERLGLPRPLSVKRVNVSDPDAEAAASASDNERTSERTSGSADVKWLCNAYGDAVDDFVKANRAEFDAFGYSCDIADAFDPPESAP
ncbi:MAG: sulfotransferase family 2 domain-containing protein [Pseudomonadota bacterium]